MTALIWHYESFILRWLKNQGKIKNLEKKRGCDRFLFCFFWQKHLREFNEFPSVWLQATNPKALPTLLIFSSALLLKNLAFIVTGCFGAFPSPKFCSIPIVPHQWWEQLRTCVWQHLPMSAHWPRTTVYQGSQWVRSSGSSLSGNASHQLSQSNLGDICWSWSCDDSRHQHCFGLPPWCFLCLLIQPWPCLTWSWSFGSSSVWMACWWPRCKSRYWQIWMSLK